MCVNIRIIYKYVCRLYEQYFFSSLNKQIETTRAPLLRERDCVRALAHSRIELWTGSKTGPISGMARNADKLQSCEFKALSIN